MEEFWKRPAWVTAIVGLVSAFLTIPEMVGNYLQQQQEIETLKLNKKFQVVNSALKQKGKERIFLMRYLATTFDEGKIKDWASEEVLKLENIAKMEAELELATSSLLKNKQELGTQKDLSTTHSISLSKDIYDLEVHIENLKRSISNSFQLSGLKTYVDTNYKSYVVISAKINWSSSTYPGSALGGIYEGDKDEPYTNCYENEKYCTALLRESTPPKSIVLYTLHDILDLTVIRYKGGGFIGAYGMATFYSYNCHKEEDFSWTICKLIQSPKNQQ